jgi:DNA ligase D-like protein (predicted ligase)
MHLRLAVSMKRSLNTVHSLSPDLRKNIKKVRQPSFIPAMLATLTNDYFSSKEWLYEHKFDGERCIAIKKKGMVTLMSRNRKKMNAAYPELVEALTKQPADNFIIDGEIISVNKKGVSDFELLQGRINLRATSERAKQKKIPITYCVFDLMYVDSSDIRALPLYARKKLLKTLFRYNKLLRYTQHKIGDGITFFKQACKLHWEGLIAKRIESKYVGVRSRDWLKFKCIMKQELIIVGYTDPQRSRSYFGALLVGYYKAGKLMYAGKVGTGYSEETLALLGKKLQKITITKCPFADYDGALKSVNWVKPVLVAEFEFAQWTNAGRLRVGRYKGLRDDKKAKDVVKETPKAIGPLNRKSGESVERERTVHAKKSKRASQKKEIKKR